ncbi:MAG: hypothetical protein WBA22_05320 [Candidatus Methanofastidiosia archaeon]
MIGRVNPPEAQQTIAPIFSFLNTRPLKWRAHIPINIPSLINGFSEILSLQLFHTKRADYPTT